MATPHYAPAFTSTYVKYTSSFSGEIEGVDPTKVLTDRWYADSGITGSQKFNYDIGVASKINELKISNGHVHGAWTDDGAKTVRVYGTNSATAFANTTYADTTDLTLVSADPVTFTQHTAADVEEFETFALDDSTAYRYFVLRIVDNWGGTDLAISHVEYGGDGGVGGVSLGAVSAAGDGGGTGGVTAGSVEAAAEGSWGGGATLAPVEAEGEGSWGGGVILNNVTVAATGDDSIPMQAQGDWGFSTESGITMASHIYMAVRGDLGFYAESGISILNNTIQGDLGFSMESGIQMTASNAAVVQGDLGFEMESGIQMASHIAMNAGGQLGLSMTSGIEMEADISARAVGELGFFMESGITMYSRPQAAVEGELGFFMESGIIADGGDTCAGVLAHVRGQVC